MRLNASTRRNRNAVPAQFARFRGSNDQIVGQDGHINAGSTKELMSRLVEIANMVQSGDISMSGIEVANDSGKSKDVILREAYDNPGDWSELGAAISGEITSRIEREGFMRQVLERYDIGANSIPRIRVHVPNVRAIASRGVTQIWPQFVRDRYMTAEEFYITANPRVEKLEIYQGSPNILEDKFFEGLEAIMVTEDIILKKQADLATALYNDPVYYAGETTPLVIAQVMQKVSSNRLPIGSIIMGTNIMLDFLVGSAFSTYMDPVSKFEIIQTGRIGQWYGADVITDGFREPTLAVLDPGEFYVFAQPKYVGGYTDRGPVESTPQDMTGMHVPARGWTLEEIVSITIANAKAVAKGKKL